MTQSGDLYKILGVPRTATAVEIKKAFHRLAKKNHPDKNPHSWKEATRKFTEIIRAYRTLSDQDLRNQYDRASAPKQDMKNAPNSNSTQSTNNFNYNQGFFQTFAFPAPPTFTYTSPTPSAFAYVPPPSFPTAASRPYTPTQSAFAYGYPPPPAPPPPPVYAPSSNMGYAYDMVNWGNQMGNWGTQMANWANRTSQVKHGGQKRDPLHHVSRPTIHRHNGHGHQQAGVRTGTGPWTSTSATSQTINGVTTVTEVVEEYGRRTKTKTVYENGQIISRSVVNDSVE